VLLRSPVPCGQKQTGDVPSISRYDRQFSGTWIPPCCLPLEGLLADSNFDLPWLGFRPLRHGDLQNPFFIAGFHLLRVHGVRELKGADKRAVPALNAMEILFFLFLLKLALALD